MQYSIIIVGEIILAYMHYLIEWSDVGKMWKFIWYFWDFIWCFCEHFILLLCIIRCLIIFSCLQDRELAPSSSSIFKLYSWCRQGVSISFIENISEFMILSRNAAQLTRVVLEFTGVVVMTNSLKTCMSASWEAYANTAAFTKVILGARDGRTEVSRTGVADLSGTKDLISLEGWNVMLPNIQSINGL